MDWFEVGVIAQGQDVRPLFLQVAQAAANKGLRADRESGSYKETGRQTN